MSTKNTKSTKKMALCGRGFQTPSLMFYQIYKYSKRYGTGYKPVPAVGLTMSFSDSVGWANSFIVCPPFTAQKVGKKSVAHPTVLVPVVIVL